MKFYEALGTALRSERPLDELRVVAQKLLASGVERDQVLELFEHVRQGLRQTGRETDEDNVTDAMDFIDGWCSPHMRLEEQPQPKAFEWTYPVYYVDQGTSCAALSGPESVEKPFAAIAIFTDLALAEQFLRLGKVSGTPVPLRTAEEFSLFLCRVLPPATSVAFNPPSGRAGPLVVKVCVKISTLLEKLRSWNPTIASGKESQAQELVLSSV